MLRRRLLSIVIAEDSVDSVPELTRVMFSQNAVNPNPNARLIGAVMSKVECRRPVGYHNCPSKNQHLGEIREDREIPTRIQASRTLES